MTFALMAPHPHGGHSVVLPLAASNHDDANLAGFALATRGRLLGLAFPLAPDRIAYLATYDHNGPRLTAIVAATIEDAEGILTTCLDSGIVQELEDF